MTSSTGDAGASDRAFALLQELLPQHLMSRTMHRVARSTRPWLRDVLLRTVLRAYPQIDLREAIDPDPFAYPSFNAFFTRALKPGVRPLEAASVSLGVIARELFSTYILPFEMLGLLLLVAVVAASWVAQKAEPGESGESPHALAEPDAPAEGVGTAKQGVPR